MNPVQYVYLIPWNRVVTLYQSYDNTEPTRTEPTSERRVFPPLFFFVSCIAETPFHLHVYVHVQYIGKAEYVPHESGFAQEFRKTIVLILRIRYQLHAPPFRYCSLLETPS